MKVFIECEAGSRIKLEYGYPCGSSSKEELILGRILDIPFPAYYGHVVDSVVQPDGDLLDAFVCENVIGGFKPGDIIEVEPKYVIEMEDNGVRDDKVLCGRLFSINLIEVTRVIDFLEVYKQGVKVFGYRPYDTDPLNVLPTGEEYYEPR